MNSRMQMISMLYPRRKRRIGTRAPQIHYEVSCNVGCYAGSKLVSNNMQREVQSRCNTRAAQHGPILNENAIVQNTRRRVYPAQLIDMGVMRSALTT